MNKGTTTLVAAAVFAIPLLAVNVSHAEDQPLSPAEVVDIITGEGFGELFCSARRLALTDQENRLRDLLILRMVKHPGGRAKAARELNVLRMMLLQAVKDDPGD